MGEIVCLVLVVAAYWVGRQDGNVTAMNKYNDRLEKALETKD